MLYIDGKWSHCGVDALTPLKIDGAWQVTSHFHTVEPPPAGSEQPAGPSAG